MDGVNERHDDFGGGWRQFGHQAFEDGHGRVLDPLRQAGEHAFVVVVVLIEGGYVDPPDLGKAVEQIFPRRSCRLPGFVGVDDVVDDLFPLADDKGIDEGGHGFGVEGGMTTRNNQRVLLGAVRGEEGDARQVQQIQGVRVQGLIGQGEAHDVEGPHRVLGFQSVEGDTFPAHEGFHVRPGREGPFGQGVLSLVDDVVEHGQAQVGHAQVVNVGEHQGYFNVHGGPGLHHLVQFPAGVPGRTLDFG